MTTVLLLRLRQGDITDWGEEMSSRVFSKLGSSLAATALEGLSFSFSVLSFRMGR